MQPKSQYQGQIYIGQFQRRIGCTKEKEILISDDKVNYLNYKIKIHSNIRKTEEIN